MRLSLQKNQESPDRQKSGSYAKVALDVRKDTVAKRACFFDITGAQGEAQAFRRSIRLMNGNVAPPHTAVVPQVMVGIFVVNTKRDFGLGGWHVE